MQINDTFCVVVQMAFPKYPGANGSNHEIPIYQEFIQHSFLIFRSPFLRIDIVVHSIVISCSTESNPAAAVVGRR